MVNHRRQEPDARSQLKCSRCREKKIKCTPIDRRWEEKHQKCDNCKKHDDLPCGPNRRARDKRPTSRSRHNHAVHGDDSFRDPGDEPRTPASQPTGTQQNEITAGEGNEEQLSMVVENPKNPRKRKLTSTDEDLVDEANRRLEKLNSIGRAYKHASLLTPVGCRDSKKSDMYNNHPNGRTRACKDIFHSIFVRTCQLGDQLYKRGKNSDAGRIFLKLSSAWQRYIGIGDNRFHGPLRIMAKFFEETGDRDEYEVVLIQIAETYTSIHDQNPHGPLANSLNESSKRTNDDLSEFWEEHYMVPGEMSLALPPIQRLAQLRRIDVGSILLHLPNSFERSPPALFNLEALHIAAARGDEETLVALLEAGAPVDALDIHHHTALFLAALKGHDGCCAQLIERNADFKLRNVHGNTILEVAAGAGHIEIVKRLVRAGAEVDPHLMCCSSSPLQAAIENAKSPLELATYLIEQKADMSVKRWDGKTALDLAENRDRSLASYMRQKQVQVPQDPFNQRQVYYEWLDPRFGPAPVSVLQYDDTPQKSTYGIER